MFTSSEDLVNIRQFKETFFGLTHWPEREHGFDEKLLDTLEYVKIQFETQDLVILNPDDEIRNAIEREMGRNDHKERYEREQMEMIINPPGEDADDPSFLVDQHLKVPATDLANMIMLTADVPSFDSLTNQSNVSLHCLSVEQKCESKISKGNVNYLTEQMHPVDGHEPVSMEEVVLQVALYDRKKSLKTQEYLVLGSQCLTELKDSISCISDQIFEAATTKSGYFCIENVFYNDMRSSDAIDYSENIRNWLVANNRSARPEFGNYSTSHMETTTFNALSVRMGVPYIYCHRGNCEHFLVFHDVRLIHSEDNLNKKAYPLPIFQNRIRRKKCRVCDIHLAKFVAEGDPLAPENPCFYCEQCFQSLHFRNDATQTQRYPGFTWYQYYQL